MIVYLVFQIPAEKVFGVGFLGLNTSSQGIWKPGCNLLQFSSVTLSHCHERWSQKPGCTRIFSCKGRGPSASFSGPPTQVCIHPRKINSLNLKMNENDALVQDDFPKFQGWSILRFQPLIFRGVCILMFQPLVNLYWHLGSHRTKATSKNLWLPTNSCQLLHEICGSYRFL